ncbi:MAG: transporter [Bacteroidota bacterium]
MSSCFMKLDSFLAFCFLIFCSQLQANGKSITATDTVSNLAADVQNPVANMISIPFQLDIFNNIGSENKTAVALSIQPVIPIKLSANWNIITRTIIPLIYLPDGFNGLDILPQNVTDNTKIGLGDINISGFLSPAEPGKIIWGVGPCINLPTASNSYLGSQKWSAGPTFAVLTQPEPWTIGILVNQLWSFAGDKESSDVDQIMIQPFFGFNLSKGWYLTSSPIITRDWTVSNKDGWMIPIGAGCGRIITIGKLPVNISLEGYYYVDRPVGGPDSSLRFTIELLLPQ